MYSQGVVGIEVFDGRIGLQQLEAAYSDDTDTEGEGNPTKTKSEDDPVIKKN